MNVIPSSVARIACGAALFSLALAASAQAEIRGVWASRFQWASTNPATAKNNIDNITSNMAIGRFNTLFFQIRGQGETMYPSPDEPWSLTVSANNTDPGWNPLQYAVTSAHNRGMKIHAYFNTHTIWSGATDAPPSSMPNHIYYQHANPNDPARRDWLLYNASGAPTTYRTGVDEYLWMNPGVPAADAFIRKQAVHLVTNYDIDGLHFDRVRMPAIGFGKNPIAVARWDNPGTSTANDGPGNPSRLSWDSFMRESITRHLINICGQCWGVDRLVPMSSAPLGLWEYSSYYQGLGGYSSGFQWAYRIGQDAKAWMQMGAQDFIVPQIYWANGGSKPDFNEVFDDWLSAANTHGRYVVPGANNSVGQTEVESNARYVRTRGGNGKGLNLWQVLNTNWSTWAASGHPYAGTTPATPTFPWRDTEGVIIGKVFTNSTLSTPVTDAWITRNGSAWTALSSGDGFFSFLRVPPGTYTLSFTHPTFGSSTRTSVIVTAGQATNVNLSFTGGGTAEIIVDNSNSGFTASSGWNLATSAADKYGADYRFRNTSPGNTDNARWNPGIATSRSYQVYAWWSQGTNRSAAASYRVIHSGGTTTVNRSQSINGGSWQNLGTFNMNSSSRVELSCSATNGYVVIADAVRLVPQ